MVKVCHVCASDVSHQKRIKDAQGRYYCEACYRTLSRRGGHGAPDTAPPPVAEKPKPAAIPLDDDGPLELADDVKKAREPEKTEAMFGCADCKKIVPEKQIRNDDGDFVCLACYAKRRQKAPAAVAVPKKKKLLSETEGEGDENREGWKDTLVGGAIISAGVIVVTFAVYLVLYLYLPTVKKGEVAPGVLLAALMAGVATVFSIFQAAALLVSMVLAARLLGGIEFGYIGSALWKSLALVLGFGVLSFFSSRFEAVWMLSYGFKLMALIVAFVVVFKIDFFEAMILTFINFIVFMALAIAMAGVLLSLSGHGHGDDDEPTPMHQNEAAPVDNGGL